MTILFIILTILGLSLFEIITSIDNAIINAEVLSTTSKKAKKWFLTWGIIFAVFVVRGLLPLLIIMMTNPSLGIIGAITAAFSNDPHIAESIEKSSPILLLGGGVFMIFLFLHWLFLEPKKFGLKGERFLHEQGAWFYAIVSILLSVIVWLTLRINPILSFSAVIGSTAFFIIHGFRQYAEQEEKNLLSKGSMSDFSKILYLEILDTSFSIDGVIGAFAFTFSVIIILVGNGLGAFVLRHLTIRHIENIKKYVFLKNGAMYSIFVLGCIMLLNSFGLNIPAWLSPVSTFIIVGYFFNKSRVSLNNLIQ